MCSQIKNIILAQIASDSGKSLNFVNENPYSKEAEYLGYEVKEYYIFQAVRCNSKNVSISKNMDIIYFTGIENGYEWQISFHVFNDFPENLLFDFPEIQIVDETFWNGVQGGSRFDAMILARKYFNSIYEVDEYYDLY